MKRLKILIFIFCLALTIPLGYFVLRTYDSLAQEEEAELRFFAETLFDRMEEELARLVNKEEKRAIDEYSFSYSSQTVGEQKGGHSPLSKPPREGYILGYFQNEPDGSFQTPLAEDKKDVQEQTKLIAQLDAINKDFNRKRSQAPEAIEVEPFAKDDTVQKEKEPAFAEKYFASSRSKSREIRLGQKAKRVEEVSIAQVQNLARQDIPAEQETPLPQLADQDISQYAAGALEAGDRGAGLKKNEPNIAADWDAEDSSKPAGPAAIASPVSRNTFQVEVDPLQSVSIDKNHIFLFRRIVVNNQIFRQGFVIKVNEFLNHLVETYFQDQPMARFTNLQLEVSDQGRQTAVVIAGTAANSVKFSLSRIFPRPFSFLHATLNCDQVPRSEGRDTLTLMIVMLAAIMLAGLFAIYQSARVVLDLSERRSSFVSSVTHELKTPLTNIRMYTEMLEQGIAQNPEREQEYFRIVNSESSRLARLINNVLEFARLERKQRPLDLRQGDFSEVLREVQAVMQEKIRQEGFLLKIKNNGSRSFTYDREVMIQILINLVENSMKFGKNSPQKEITIRINQGRKKTDISVTDTGPGIAPSALKKVFEDFFREDSSLTRNTKGTGIGLALVNKFVSAMGGTVSAANNKGPGCTITIVLPS